MGKFSWLHISDAHFGNSDSDAHWNALCDAIQSNSVLCGCFYVFITGDIANRGKFDNSVKQKFEKLREAFGSNMPKFFWSFGNHDVAFDSDSIANRKSRDRIITDSIVAKNNTYSARNEAFIEIMSNSRDSQLFKNGFEVAERYANEIAINKGIIQSDGNFHKYYSDDKINIFILNTSVVASETNAVFVPIAGVSNTLRRFNNSNPTFVLAHHPLIFVDDINGAELEEAMHYADVYLCGHTHKAKTSLQSDYVEITVGSVTGCRFGDATGSPPNNFIYGSYDGNGYIHIECYTYNHGWDKDDRETKYLYNCCGGKIVINRLFNDKNIPGEDETGEIPGQDAVLNRYENIKGNAKLNAIIADEDELIDVGFNLSIDGKKKEHSLKNLHDLWKTENEGGDHLCETDLSRESRLLFLLGNGGTGKSFALRRIEHSLLKKPGEYGAKDGIRSVIFVELNRIHSVGDAPIMDYISDMLFYANNEGFKNFCSYWSLARNKVKPLIIILDGLNEILVDKQRIVLSEVDKLIDIYNIFVIISSRYADNLYLDRYYTHYWQVELKELADEEIEKYLGKAEFSTLKQPENSRLLSFLRIPLMLALYRQTSPYYTPFNKLGRTMRTPLGIKYYGPVYSESTIIYNYFQSLLDKVIRKPNFTDDEQFHVWVALNLVTPYIAFYMQSGEAFSISNTDMEECIAKVCDRYSRLCVEKKGYFDVVSQRLNAVKPSILSEQKVKGYLLDSLAVFTKVQSSFFEETTYELFHQQLRDCLSAIHFINELELSIVNGRVTYIPEIWQNIELTSKKILSYRFVTRHIAMLEERNRVESTDKIACIDKLWNYILSLSKTGSIPRTILRNIIEVYKHLLKDNFSSLNFRGIDLSGINLGIYNFTPEDTSSFDEHAFDGAVFDAKTFPLGGHIGAVYSVDACGSKLASYSANSIILWDIFTRQGVDSLYLPETVLFEKGAEPAVCFCPTDNETIAFNYIGGIIEMKLPLHDVGATDRMFDFENDNVVSLCYSPNGKYLSAACTNGMTCIWDVESMNRIYYGLGVPKLQISNTFLLRQVMDGAEVLDFTKGNMIQFIPFTKGEYVRCAVFTRNEACMFFLTINEESVKLYSWRFGEEEPSVLREFNEFILDLSVSDDGQQLSLCRLNFGDCVIDTTDGKTLGEASVKGLPWCCSYIANPPKGYENIFFTGTNTGRIWGSYAQNGILYALSLYDGHRPCANSISLRNDERYILAAYDDGMIREWKIRDEINNLAVPLLSHVYSEHKGSVSCVVYSDNGEYFASCSTDGSIILWDTYTKVNIFEIENAHEQSVKGVLFTDEGKLISYGNKGEIKLWNIETRELLLSFPIIHNDLITDMFYCFGEDYNRAVSCSLDGQIIIWKIDGAKVTQEHVIDCPEVRSLSFCEQTRTFFSNSRDNSIRKWSLISNKPIGSEIVLPSENLGSRNARSITSSKDGNRILFADDGEEYNLSGCDNHILEIVFETNKCKAKISAHTGNVMDVVYLSDECYAVSASLDGNIAILDLREGKVIHTAHIVTDFETKLGAFNLENIVYRPKWIKKFYAGVTSETPKINAPEHLEKMAVSLRNGVIINIFDFIKEEKDITPLVDLFFSCTIGLSDPTDRKATEFEKEFFLANVYYLWYEAPKDEQNMFMLAELFIAALDSENREDTKDYESDLDRLFNMLREIKPSHIALELYSKYKQQLGKKFTIQSCYKRLYPVCGNAKCDNGQKSFFYFEEKDCEKFIDSVTANFNERKATEEEKVLLISILSRSLSDVNIEVSLYNSLKKQKFLSDNERTVFDELFGECMDFFREF